MQELRDKLCKIDQETDWIKIMGEVEKPEIQIQIRAELGRAIKRIDKTLKRKNEDNQTIS